MIFKVLFIVAIIIVVIAALSNWVMLLYNERTNFRNSDKLDKWCKICTRTSIIGIGVVFMLILILQIFY